MKALRFKISVLPVLFILLLICNTGADAKSYNVYKNISYSNDSNSYFKKLDIYTPADTGVHPVLVFIHGGGWMTGDKKFISEKPVYFAERGFVFVSINYRLAPLVKYPDNVKDAAEAVAWVARNIVNYGGDTAGLYLMGHSAGAHLSALISLDDKYLSGMGQSSALIKAVVLIEGAGYDIPLITREDKAVYDKFFKIPFGSDRSIWQAASPINHIRKNDGAPPYLVIYIEKRRLSNMESNLFVKRLRESGISADTMAVRGKTHFSINRSIGREGDAVTARIIEFLSAAGARIKR